MTLKDLKFNQEETCPICGKHMITYYDTESSGDEMWYNCECDDCHATWQEVYSLKFTSVDEVFNADGETIYSSFNEVQ